MHHARDDATALRPVLGTGGRIAGGVACVNRARIGIERSGSVCTGAVVFRCGGCDRGGGRRVPGIFDVPAGTGHRAHQNGGQSQRGKAPRRRPLHALNGFHPITIPFGQGRLLCLVLYLLGKVSRGGEPQPASYLVHGGEAVTHISSVYGLTTTLSQTSTAGLGRIRFDR